MSTPPDGRFGPPRVEALVGDTSLTPGQPSTVVVGLRNLEAIPRSYSFSILGVDPAWVRVDDPVGPVPPGGGADVVFTIALPAGFPASHVAANLEIRVKDPDTGAVAGRPITVDLVLEVGDGSLISAALEPADVRGREHGRLRVVLRNRGQSSLRVELSAQSVSGEVHVRFAETTIALMPGQEARVKARLRARRPAIGQVKRRPFAVRVQGRSTPVLLDGSFTQKPVLSSTLFTFVTVVVVIAMFATGIVVGLGRLSTTLHRNSAKSQASSAGPPAGAPIGGGVTGGPVAGGAAGGSGTGGSGAAGGPASPTGAAGGASAGSRVSGKVTAADASGITVTIAPTTLVVEKDQMAAPLVQLASAGPLGKIRAEVTAADVGRAIGTAESTTTTPDGAWAFAGVHSPGYYLVTFSKPGYQTQSYVVTTTADNQPVLLGASLKPGSGGLSGSVFGATGPLGGVDIAITNGTVTLKTRTPTTGAVGTWAVGGLSTPGTYLITAVRAGYATQTTMVALKAGQSQAGVNLTMPTGAGTITGTISSAQGNVGGVTVTASNATTTLTATTSTVDPVGTYTLPDLPVPASYTVTVSGDGWSTETQQVQLTGNAVVNATLTPTTASVSGIIADGRDPTGKTGLANAGLTLANDQVSFKSLSASVPAGQFALANIPPGHYVLTAQEYEFATQVALVDVGPGDSKVVNLTLPFVGPADQKNAMVSGHVGSLFDPTTKFLPPGLVVTPDDPTASVVYSGSPGDYTISKLTAGIHQIRASYPGYESVTVQVSVALSGIAVAPTALLPKLDTLSGTVSSNAGGLVANVVATLYDSATRQPVPICTTGSSGPCVVPVPPTPDGHYELDSITHGNYLVAFSAPGFDPETVPPVAPANAKQINLGVGQDQIINASLDRLPLLQVNTYQPAAGATLNPLSGVTVTVNDTTKPSTVIGPANPQTTGGAGVVNFALPKNHGFSVTFATPVSNSPMCMFTGIAQSVPPVCGLPAAALNHSYFLTAIFDVANDITGQLVWDEPGQTLPVPVPVTPAAAVTMTAVDSYNFSTPGGPGTPHTTSYTHDATSASNASPTLFDFPPSDRVLSTTADFLVSAPGFQTFSQKTVPVQSGPILFTLTPRPRFVTGSRVVLQSGTDTGDTFAGITVTATYQPSGAPAQVRVTVNADGTLSWTDLTISAPKAVPGDYSLTFHKDGYQDSPPTDFFIPLCTSPADCAASVPVPAVTVTLRKLITINASAVDGSGTPVDGTRFALYRNVDPAQPATTGTLVTTSNPTGNSAVFANLARAGAPYKVVATAAGYAIPGPYAVVTSGGTSNVVLTLTRLASISGTLNLQAVSPGGSTSPAVGVTITATGTAAGQPCQRSFSTVTTPQGNFSITGNTTCQGLLADQYTVSATVAGYPALSVPVTITDTTDHSLGVITLLAVPQDVSGTITDGVTGRGVPGVKVVAVSQITSQAYSATTDANGTYTLSGLPPVGYSVTFTKSGYAQLSGIALNLHPGTPPPTLNEVMTRFANTLLGRVLGQYGSQPPAELAGAQVDLQDPSSHAVRYSATTADDGKGHIDYAINNIDDGNYLVVVTATGFNPSPGQNTGAMAGGFVYTMPDITLTAKLRNVDVTVNSAVTTAGAPTPIVGAKVTLTATAGSTGRTQGPQATGAGGVVTFNQVIPDSKAYTISVDTTGLTPPHKDQLLAPTTVAVPLSDATTNLAQPVNLNEVEVKGTGTAGTGAGSATVAVTITGTGPGVTPAVTNGSYDAYLAPDTYNVNFSAPGYNAQTKGTGALTSGTPPKVVDATLVAKAHTVTVKVVAGDGTSSPVPGLTVTLAPGGATAITAATTGIATFNSVAPGAYSASVVRPQAPAAPDTVGSGPVQVDITDTDPLPQPVIMLHEGQLTGTAKVTPAPVTPPAVACAATSVTVTISSGGTTVSTQTVAKDAKYTVVLKGGPYNVVFSAPGCTSSATLTPTVTEGASVTQNGGVT